MRTPDERSIRRASRHRAWHRFGLAGFLFFLCKGLLWVLVPTMLWLESCSDAALVGL